jgi:hypothetical protein
LETQNQTHPFWLSGADHPTAPIAVAAVSNNNPVPPTKSERRIQLHRYALPKVDATCETAKKTKGFIQYFEVIMIGDTQE